jgi:hypothetical protein
MEKGGGAASVAQCTRFSRITQRVNYSNSNYVDGMRTLSSQMAPKPAIAKAHPVQEDAPRAFSIFTDAPKK